MRNCIRIVALLAPVMLAACGRAPLETEANTAARTFYESLRAGDWAKVEAQISPGLAQAPDRARRFEQMRAALPAGRLQEARTVGWARTQVGGVKRMDTVHVYRYPGADLVVGTALVRTPPTNEYRVTSLVTNRLAPGRIEAHRFTLAGKGPRQLGFLATALLSPLVMLGMAALVVMTPGLKLKPVWFLLCFVGVGSAYINWSSGQAGFNAAQISLVNFGFTRATDISPWFIRFSAPVGALVVLVRLLLHRPRVAAPT